MHENEKTSKMNKSDFILSKIIKHKPGKREPSKFIVNCSVSRPAASTNHLFPTRNRDAALVETTDAENFLLLDVRAIIEPCRFRTRTQSRIHRQ